MRTLALLSLAALAIGCSSVTRAKGSGKLEPFAPEGVTSSAAAGKRYALLVGISSFEDEKFEDLRYPGADVDALGDALDEFDEVIRVTGEKATGRAAILAAMKKLGGKVRGRRDTVVVYFSTHGTLARTPGEGLGRYLVTRDTRMDVIAESALSVESVIGWMDGLPSRRKALILATCHSGEGKSQVSDELERALARSKSAPIALESVSEASIILSASAHQEVATEDERLGHDVYTHFLLEGIQRGDRDQDGAVTISEAHDWARERTYLFTHGIQRPSAQSSILGRDPIILRGSVERRPKPVVYSYEPSSKGVVVDVDGAEVGVLPGGIVLEPGRRAITLRSGSGEVLHEGEVEVGMGDRIDVAELIPRPWRWSVRALGLGLGPLDADVRSEFVPWTPGAGAQASVYGWPWEAAVLEVGGSWGASAGDVDAFGATLPFELELAQVYAGAGARLPVVDTLDVVATGRVGGLWATRRFETPGYRDVESLRGARVGAHVGLSWSPLEHATFGVGAELMGLDADLGQRGWYVLGSLEASAGVRF